MPGSNQITLMIAFFMTIPVDSVKVSVTMKMSQVCGQFTGTIDNGYQMHVNDDKGLFLTALAIYHIGEDNMITSGAYLTGIPVTKGRGTNLTYTYTLYNYQKDRYAKFDGPYIEYKSEGRYEMVMCIGSRRIYRTEMPAYFIDSTDIFRNSGWRFVYDDGEFPGDESGFLIGDITVQIDGKTVLSRKDSKNLCWDSHQWIPQRGYYRFDGKRMITMYYFPHYFPHYLT
ncbi:unnamed protein product [Nippostrongylus brasiliensis]|uniref:Transthyretin-like family protein n=1 Tax=Nippostrongylus brasiliensis TaxID=27835 RepID=A0A0N4Y9Q6_NIPBR|nr:hypothetical protein Q1695_011732 [Nippostrongylus brasiliensis]VDL76655.1 unnamed protein product [Nippostrongylus brasiliensis]